MSFYIDNVALSFTPGINEISGEVCSGFESYGFDGWNCENVASVTYSETGGNPGGAMQIGDASNQISLAYSPWKFLGDWSVLGANAVFHFDLRVNASASLYMSKEYLVKISGSGGTAIIPPDYIEIGEAKNQWKTFTIPIDPAEWTVTSGVIAASGCPFTSSMSSVEKSVPPPGQVACRLIRVTGSRINGGKEAISFPAPHYPLTTRLNRAIIKWR